METPEDSSQYLKIILVVLVLVLMFVGMYGLYIKFFSPRPKVASAEVEVERTVKQVDRLSLDTVYDLTSANIPTGQVTTIEGKFISADVEDRIIEGQRYVYVIGIENADGSSTKIHLNQEEYELFGGTLPLGEFYRTQVVLVKISSSGIDLVHI